MKGDFSRWTFDRTKHYSRVLLQQGRVSLDADFNEALEIQLQRIRALSLHLIGPHAGVGNSFRLEPLSPAGKDFAIDAGVYYVEGVPCELTANVNYSAQPNLLNPPALVAGTFVAYLDVWERFLTYIEDEDPAEVQQSIREVALAGPDTAGRSQVVWQVRLMKAPDTAGFKNDDAGLAVFRAALQKLGIVRGAAGKLAARARKPKADDQPCATSPQSRYRGPENQLYRVEIHNGGVFGVQQPAGGPIPTFKWSRENGSVVFPIRSIDNTMVTVETLGRDERLGLETGDIVEVADDDYVLQNRAEPLLTVKSIDAENFLVELSQAPASPVGTNAARHPILRRWDGAAGVSKNPDPESGGYLALEDGVEVLFTGGDYRTADYWMIPARTATGDVEWPGTIANPLDVPPHGVTHWYAPLAFVTVDGQGNVTAAPVDLRRKIMQLWS